MTDKSIQFLNVDDVEPSVSKVLTIKGVQHKFKQASVGEFVSEMKRIRALQKKYSGESELDQIDLMEAMIESQKLSVKNAFPTVNEEDLNGLNNDQLAAIREFIQKQFDVDNEEAKDDLGNAPAAKKKSKR